LRRFIEFSFFNNITYLIFTLFYIFSLITFMCSLIGAAPILVGIVSFL